MQRITATRFKAQCLALIDQVAAGREPLIVLKHGKPMVQLVPLPLGRADSPFGIGSGGRILADLVARERAQ